MPDHDGRGEPGKVYTLTERIRGNALTLTFSALGTGAATIMASDLMTGHQWIASYALQFVPDVTQFLIVSLLFVGSVATAIGALVRKIRRNGKTFCTISTLQVEMYGWIMELSGWLAVFLSVTLHSRPGTALTLWIMGCLVAGCAAKAFLCGFELHKMHREIRAQKVTTGQLDVIGGV